MKSTLFSFKKQHGYYLLPSFSGLWLSLTFIFTLIFMAYFVYAKISQEYNQYNYVMIKHFDLSDEEFLNTELNNSGKFKNHSTLKIKAKFYDEKKSQVSISAKDDTIELTVLVSNILDDDSDPKLPDFKKEYQQSFENLKVDFTKSSNQADAYLVTQKFVSDLINISNKYEK